MFVWCTEIGEYDTSDNDNDIGFSIPSPSPP
jgi:hypothetical protein